MDPNQAHHMSRWLAGDLDEGGEYMQMQQAMAMGGPGMMDPVGLGAAYPGPFGGQAMLPNNPSLTQAPQLGGLAAPANPLDPALMPEWGSFVDDSVLPGEAIDYDLPYGRSAIPYAYGGHGRNPAGGLTADAGMPLGTSRQDFPMGPVYPGDTYADMLGQREDAALGMGIIGDPREDAFRRAQMPALGEHRSRLQPFGPDLFEHPPPEYTREQFMREELPYDIPWGRNAAVQPPLMRHDRRQGGQRPRGPVYEEPSILGDHRRVHFS